MTGPHREDHLFRIEVLEGKSGHLVGCGKPAHDQIEVSHAQLLEKDCVFSGDDLDACAGLFLQE